MRRASWIGHYCVSELQGPRKPQMRQRSSPTALSWPPNIPRAGGSTSAFACWRRDSSLRDVILLFMLFCPAVHCKTSSESGHAGQRARLRPQASDNQVKDCMKAFSLWPRAYHACPFSDAASRFLLLGCAGSAGGVDDGPCNALQQPLIQRGLRAPGSL